jgi:hypothetical protein
MDNLVSQLSCTVETRLVQHPRIITCHLDPALSFAPAFYVGRLAGSAGHAFLVIRVARLNRLLHEFRGAVTPTKEIAALAADRSNVDLAVRSVGNKTERSLGDIAVECAGEALIPRNHDQQHPLFIPLEQ